MDANALIQRERFDVVLCDIVLPGEDDGFTLENGRLRWALLSR